MVISSRPMKSVENLQYVKEENKHSSQIPSQGPLPHTLFSNEDHILVGVEGSQEVDEVLLVVAREDDLLIIAVESLV